MKKIVIITLIPLSALIFSCGGDDNTKTESSQSSFIKDIEKKNNISYTKVVNKTAYIPPQCYTKTVDENNTIHNPCYSCHTKGKVPNYIIDTDLQLEYAFPKFTLTNHFENFFKKDVSEKLNQISDEEILNYVRTSNYFDKNGEIALKKVLPKDWKGYIPDCYFNFDDEGFDINPKTNEYTGWRAFRYYPFLGTFWPTNGSTDDVLIRLPKAFMEDENGNFNKEIYKINLSIVESVVKQKDIPTEPLNETLVNIDLDKDGQISIAHSIKYTWDKDKNSMTYVGKAKKLLEEGKIHLAGGLFPKGTEFLHTVRYIDWDEQKGKIKLAKRMKEVRYMKKAYWMSYAELKQIADKEFYEMEPGNSKRDFPPIEIFSGNFEEGIDNGIGWVLQGYIEDKKGNLRPQTQEETLYCMGCHGGIGATTDSVFSFPRKFEDRNKENKLYGWGHWTQKDLTEVPEPKVKYEKYGEKYEYTFYLQNNKSGNEFRSNTEVIKKFFNPDGTLKQNMINKLHSDITVLLYPSKERALLLDKTYKVIVETQSFSKGREAIGGFEKTVHKQVEPYQETGIENAVY